MEFVTCGKCYATVCMEEKKCSFCGTEITEDTIITTEELDENNTVWEEIVFSKKGD